MLLAPFKKDKSEKSSKNISILNIGADLVSYAIVGIIIGRFLDKFFETKLIFLLICLVLGLISAISKLYLSK